MYAHSSGRFKIKNFLINVCEILVGGLNTDNFNDKADTNIDDEITTTGQCLNVNQMLLAQKYIPTATRNFDVDRLIKLSNDFTLTFGVSNSPTILYPSVGSPIVDFFFLTETTSSC